MKKVAVFVDWSNAFMYIRKSAEIQKIDPRDVTDDVAGLTFFLCSFLTLDEELFRIYFYHAAAMASEDVELFVRQASRFDPEDEKNFEAYWKGNGSGYSPSERQQFSHEKSTEFHDRIREADGYSLRLGEQRCQSLDSRGRPLFVQKQTDMLLGLDIAHVAFQHHADRIMVFSADTDIVPALDLARLNGLQTVTCYVNRGFRPDLRIRQSCDFVRTLDISAIQERGRASHWRLEGLRPWEA